MLPEIEVTPGTDENTIILSITVPENQKDRAMVFLEAAANRIRQVLLHRDTVCHVCGQPATLSVKGVDYCLPHFKQGIKYADST